ncbi:MAG: TraR/DksA family transcriptional regulator [Thiobacillus sp.]|jgi:RNA polymerase-binding protein DksA|nr:TraR/DksA family transcriptional regulator [Thiobacillus sp.]
MTALKQSQLDQLIMKLKQDYQKLLIEVRNEMDNTGQQHRIDLLNNEPGDSGDESMADALADLNVTQLDRHVREMRDIEAALLRVRDSEFGICIDCGSDIAFDRLQAYPTAKRCLACQEKREKAYAQEGHPSL